MRGHLVLGAASILALVSCGGDNQGPNPTPNQSPTAAFGAACSRLGCTFTDSSTDDGAVTTWSWDFGDGSDRSTEQNPVHTYATDAQYQVTLKVMDNLGAADSVFRPITVTDHPTCSDPATPDDFVACAIDIPNGNTVSVTISSESDCTADGDTLRIVGAMPEDVFTDGCHAQKDVPIAVNGGNPFLCAAGYCPYAVYLAITLESDDRRRATPSVHTEGGYPQWTIRLEDGGHPGDPNEPDFNDLVITITACQPAPDPWGY